MSLQQADPLAADAYRRPSAVVMSLTGERAMTKVSQGKGAAKPAGFLRFG